MKNECTRVVPKLMLLLSGWTCNAIYRNSDKAHVFCSAWSFQQASTDVCMSSRSRVTAGFVKTVACTPPKKGKKKINENTNLFTHIFLTFRGHTFTFSISKYHSSAAKHASILSRPFSWF